MSTEKPTPPADRDELEAFAENPMVRAAITKLAELAMEGNINGRPVDFSSDPEGSITATIHGDYMRITVTFETLDKADELADPAVN